jgi:hypothetical protein
MDMGIKRLVAIASLLVCLPFGNVLAADYKDWIPLLPEKLAGMVQTGKPEGMNMEMNEQAWSSLHQKYGSESSGKSAEVTIFGGKNAPPMTSFQTMKNMKMETEDQLVKSVMIGKYKGLLNLEKKEQRANLMIALGQEMMVVIAAEPVSGEDDILEIAEEFPLDQIAEQSR